MATKTQEKVNGKKILAFVSDMVISVLIISLINLLVVYVFGLSEGALMKKGIETSVLERKMEVYDYISLSYLALLIAYLAYFRKFYSFGERLLLRHHK